MRLALDIDAIRRDLATLLDASEPIDAGLRVLVTRSGRRIAFVEELKTLPDTIALQTITYAPTQILDGVKPHSPCSLHCRIPAMIATAHLPGV